MTVTVRQLIEEQAAGLVGRVDERAILHQLLGSGGPLVVFVHGLAGVGKSTLVQAFAVEARARGATVLRLDCRAIEPTERGFLAALASATGGELPTTTDAAARLARLGERVVLVLDTYEVFRLFDSWLQQRFVPLSSDNVRVVLSGREPPMTGWASAFGSLFRSLPLGDLPRDDAETLLRLAGVDHVDAERIDRFARGHPLSLQLAASALAEPPGRQRRGRHGPGDRRGADRALSRRAGSDDAPGARCRSRGAPADDLAACGDAARTRPRRTPSTDCVASRSWSRATTASFCTTPCVRRSRLTCARPTPTARGGTERPPGGSFATRWHGRPTTRCGATRPTCCTSSEPDRPRGVLPDDRAPLSVESGQTGRRSCHRRRSLRAWEPPASVAVLDAWWRREPGCVPRHARSTGRRRRIPHPGRARSPEPRTAARRIRSLGDAGTTCAGNRYPGASASCSTAAGWLAITAKPPRRSRPPAGSTSSGQYMELRPELRRIYSVVRDIATLGPMVAAARLRAAPRRPDQAGWRRPTTRPCWTSDRRRSMAGCRARRRRAADRRGLDPRRRPASTGPRRPTRRPDQARVRGVQLPPPASGQGRGASLAPARRLGLPTTPAEATSSRWSCGRSDASSATGPRRSRPSEAWGIGSSTRRDHQVGGVAPPWATALAEPVPGASTDLASNVMTGSIALSRGQALEELPSESIAYTRPRADIAQW